MIPGPIKPDLEKLADSYLQSKKKKEGRLHLSELTKNLSFHEINVLYRILSQHPNANDTLKNHIALKTLQLQAHAAAFRFHASKCSLVISDELLGIKPATPPASPEGPSVRVSHLQLR